MEHFEVIVVGLGAMGSATTYHLASGGTRVLGLDRLSPPHPYGSTHGDTRITRQAVGEGDAYVPFVRRSHELWRELESQAGASLLRQTGGLVMAPASGAAGMHGTGDFVAATITIAQRHRIDHDVLDADQLVRQFPQFRLGSDGIGYYEPGAGFVMAEEAVRVQLDLAERQGASVRRDERVLELHPSTEAVTVLTDQGRYTADAVVLAAGAWLPELVEPELAGLFTVYRQVLSWFELGDSGDAFAPDRCPVFIWQFGTGEEDVCYGFPAIDGPSGGVKIGTERYREPTDPDSVMRNVDRSEAAETYQRCLRGRIPELGPTAVRSVSCLYTVTPDFGFVVDHHPEHRNVVIASPCSGHGFKHSAAIGEAVAQLVTTGTSTLDISPFSLGRLLP